MVMRSGEADVDFGRNIENLIDPVYIFLSAPAFCDYPPSRMRAPTISVLELIASFNISNIVLPPKLVFFLLIVHQDTQSRLSRAKARSIAILQEIEALKTGYKQPRR